MRRGDYDYNHVTTTSQFIALVVIIAMLCMGGLALGLTLLTSIL